MVRVHVDGGFFRRRRMQPDHSKTQPRGTSHGVRVISLDVGSQRRCDQSEFPISFPALCTTCYRPRRRMNIAGPAKSNSADAGAGTASIMQPSTKLALSSVADKPRKLSVVEVESATKLNTY